MASSLDPSGRPVTVGLITVRTPGLVGTVDVAQPIAPSQRAAARAASLTTAHDDVLFDALTNARMEEQHIITFSNTRQVGGPERMLRDRHGNDGIEVTVPAPPVEHGQVLLARDEAGVASWHMAGPSTDERLRGPSTRTYVIPRNVPVLPLDAATTRGLLGSLARKVLHILVFPLLDPILGRVGDHFVEQWELHNRPYAIRSFTPGNYTRLVGEPITTQGWASLAADKALLFIHGTFSRSSSAFGDLDQATMQALYERYHGRVFAFDHPTMVDDPATNVDRLLVEVPDGTKPTVDIICHSRGGLIARELARRTKPIAVDRIVFVAAPNAGTILTNPDHMGDFIDSYTNLLGFFPENGITETLEAVISVVKQLAVATLAGLKGLEAMVPGGPFLSSLDSAIPASRRYFALTSNFVPTADASLTIKAADKVIDAVFRPADNDLVVPTDGVYQFGQNLGGFGSAPGSRLHVFAPPAAAPIHTRFFYEPVTRQKILEWLG